MRKKWLRFCTISGSPIKCDINHVNVFIKKVKFHCFLFLNQIRFGVAVIKAKVNKLNANLSENEMHFH